MKENNYRNKLLKPQKYLGKFGLIVMIAVMNMFVPLSIDMYLPALPTMTSYFATSSALVNLTLVGFFFFFAVGILVFGPLSDKYGRKPILIIGVILYTIFSGLCAMSLTIWQLIICRIIQALGAGSMVSVSTALIKDCFIGSVRDKVLAIVQALAVIGPMVAPLAGAFVLQFFSWRATFWILLAAGILCLIASLLLEETVAHSERHSGNIGQTIGRLIVVGKHKGFTCYLLIISMLAAPYMAYIAVCSYIYIDFFNLSQQVYSYFFAFNSAFAVLGPIFYLILSSRLSIRRFNWLIFIVAIASGVVLLLFGKISPWIFMISFLPFTLVESAARPFSTSILLDQHDSDTGSASALINFTQTAVGSLGMVLGALPWSNFVSGLGIVIVGFSLFAILGYIIMLKTRLNIIFLEKRP